MYPIIQEFNPDQFIDVIRNSESFVLTTHINPDGDALGSQIGLAEWLLSIGKKVSVINYSPLPEQYYFLEHERPIIEQYDSEKHDALILKSDAFLMLDTNDPERTKTMAGLFPKHTNTVLIDHHLEPKDFAKVRLIDTEASSTGELIYRLIEEGQKVFGGRISAKAAQALYVAIMTDTGSFRFPRTDSDVFQICASLIELGANPVTAYNDTYNAAKPSRLKLVAKALASLQFFFDERLATQVITQADLHEAGANAEEVDGFVQFPLQIGSLDFSIFFLQLQEGWKISFRSRGDKSAAEVAKHFGGNGHFHAAGARIRQEISYDDLLQQVCDAVAKQL